MAGMLDMLGISGGGENPGTNPYMGMLSPEMRQYVNQQALLGLSQGLLSAGAPSRVPVGFGQAMGQGLQGYQQGQQQALSPIMQMMQPQKLGAGEQLISPLTGKTIAGSPKWEMTKDAFGNPIAVNAVDPSQSQTINSAGNPFSAQGAGSTPNPAGGATAPGAGGQSSGLTGDEFLKTLPKNIGDQIKALADGRMAFPGGFALKSPYWQQMISAVSQYDPSFDAINYNGRAGTNKSFKSGPDANNVTALNTAMNHAASLKDAYDQLGNTDYPSVNTAKNWLGNTFGDQSIQTNTAAVGARGHALSGELAKVFRSTGMAESDIQAWENKLSTSATPAQSKEVLNSAMDLMEGRLQALAAKYNQGMGTTKNGIELLSPQAQKAYAKVRGIAPGSVTAGTPSSAATQSSGPAAGVVSYQDYFK